MKKILAFITILASLIMFATTNASASDDEYQSLYDSNRICFVWTDIGTVVPVVDTWGNVPPGAEPSYYVNLGTTSKSLDPCIPNDCPDGMTLASSNICAYSTPFDNLPTLTDEEIFVAVDIPPIPVVEEVSLLGGGGSRIHCS